MPTPEQIQKHVSAAFNSVDLINAEIVKEATVARKEEVTRNYRHLQIMLAKTWFAEALTSQQTIDINASIAAGTTFAA